MTERWSPFSLYLWQKHYDWAKLVVGPSNKVYYSQGNTMKYTEGIYKYKSYRDTCVLFKKISLSTEDVSWIQLKYFVEHFLWIFGRFLLHRHFDIYVSIRETNDKEIGQMNWNKRSAKQIKIHNVLKVFFVRLNFICTIFTHSKI